MENARFCIEKLETRTGAECSLSEADSLLIYGNSRYARFGLDKADAVIAVGGDGAVLRAAKKAIRFGKPLLGINGGRLGFLCAAKLSGLSDIAPDFIGRFRRSERSLIKYSLEGKEGYAVNDVIVAKSSVGATVELSVGINGTEVASWCGDGVIVATPTGSTAYNFSAGGPVLMPDTKGFTVTPVCPHTSGQRALVVSENADIRIKIIRAPNDFAVVVADGEEIGRATREISLSLHEKRLVLLTGEDPYAGFKNQ